jgi:hypothetical protein
VCLQPMLVQCSAVIWMPVQVRVSLRVRGHRLQRRGLRGFHPPTLMHAGAVQCSAVQCSAVQCSAVPSAGGGPRGGWRRHDRPGRPRSAAPRHPALPGRPGGRSHRDTGGSKGTGTLALGTIFTSNLPSQKYVFLFLH